MYKAGYSDTPDCHIISWFWQVYKSSYQRYLKFWNLCTLGHSVLTLPKSAVIRHHCYEKDIVTPGSRFCDLF